MDLAFKIIALVIYFGVMVGIGLYAFRKTSDGEDYMLGGRQLHPFTAALSAGASDMSGWLLMGLPGALYMGGLVSAWIAVGLTIGAGLNWYFVAPRLRQYTQIADNSITVPSFFGNRLHDRTHILRIAAGVIILLFFTFYVSSGMVAGGLFFQSTFGGSYLTGMLIVGGVTILYTLFGGFLGATYTDVVQGLIMLVSLIAVPLVAMTVVGGPAEMFASVREVNADFGSMTAGATVVGVISSLAWGLGYFGQPHIIVRFMALRSSRDAKYGFTVGMSWMVLCVIGAVFTALAGLAYFQQNQDAVLTDTKSGETVFLDLSQQLFHPLIAGILLAAVLAAIMSTISSQLIVSSSALVEDLVGGFGVKLSPTGALWAGRIGVLAVSVIAVVIALDPGASVLNLVGFAWAGFGAAFGPIVLLSLFWRRLTAAGAAAGMVAGAAVAFLWGQSWGAEDQPLDVTWGLFGGDHLYEIVPGFLICLVLAVGVSLITPRPAATTMEEFDDMLETLETGEIPVHRETSQSGTTA
ncbi:sodium/proline symporter PutP [Brachybacterium saurashtrense]|uniref:Sodium/proline symporter n=1 Tax=Brachybacterium saurashtrense TaxID=556288 RepID=A0A345YR25_9MICO|nr:sodium/proline symporter PutP [Brachybacterium saurashtrense]AXK46377.1 sodium/proline symporter PutP [Brachybacterium saurashtrense]RRR24118.1 sodium/proline symporter PutP [Brachybacterium saurashtrense]